MKGCITDPRPVEDMYFVIGRTHEMDLPIYVFKGGSGRNETLHSKTNRLNANYSAISAQKMQRSITIILAGTNQQIDVRYGDCDDMPVFSFKMLQLNALAHEVLSGYPFPVTAKGPLRLNHDDEALDIFGFELHHSQKTQKRVQKVKSAREDREAASVAAAAQPSDALAVQRTDHTQRNQKDVMPLSYSKTVSVTTTDEQLLLAACVVIARREVKEKGKTKQAKKAEDLYLMCLVANEGIGYGDKTFQWSEEVSKKLPCTLRGKLQLKGLISAETIAQKMADAEFQTVQARLDNLVPVQASLVTTAPAISTQVSASSAAVGTALVVVPSSAALVVPSNSSAASAAPSAAASAAASEASTALVALGMSPGALPNLAPRTKGKKRDSYVVDANALVENGSVLHRHGPNQFSVGDADATSHLSASSKDVAIMRAYVKAMKAEQKAKSKAGGTGPNIVVGGKCSGGVAKQAEMLSTQMEEYFKSWNDGSMAFQPTHKGKKKPRQ